MPIYHQDSRGGSSIRGGGSTRSGNSTSRGGSSSISCNNSYRSDGSKKSSLKSMFSRSALAKKVSMLNNSSILEDGADMSSVEVMDKYATYVSDDETSKTSNTAQKSSVKYETDDALMVISEVNETPVVYESPYHKPKYNQNYDNKNYRQKIRAGVESEGFCSADDEESFEPPPRSPSIANNNRKARRKYRNSRAPQPVSVTSDDDESFEAMFNSPDATDIEEQQNQRTNNKTYRNQGNNTLVSLQSLVCGNQVDVNDNNSILMYNISSTDSFQNSDDSSTGSAFGCHDLDFTEEIQAEIIDARLAFNRLVEYIKLRLPTQQQNHSGDDTIEHVKKRKHKKRSSRRRRS